MEDVNLTLPVFLFFVLAAALVTVTYFFILRPARRATENLRRYRTETARDLLRNIPVSEMKFVDESVRLLIDELQRKEAELQSLYRNASERAERAERHAAQVLESIPSGVLAVDPKGRITSANPAVGAILGRSERQLVGARVKEVFATSPPLVAMLEQAATSGTAFSREELAVPFDHGRVRHLAFSTNPLSGGGTEAGCTCLLTDLTHVRELEERVALQERLAAIGELSAGLAHELRNPLAAIVGYAKLLRKSAGDREDLAQPARTIVSEAESVERLVRDFLDFARPISLERTPADMRTVVSMAVAAVRFRAEHAGVAISTELPATPLPVSADAERLGQAFENLLQNAIEASPRARAIMVSALADAKEVEVRVRDRGPGISPENQTRLFTPFFSTKKSGVGMGLALVQKIAAAHGGRVTAANAAGGGAEFVLRLPTEASFPAAEPQQPHRSKPPRRRLGPKKKQRAQRK